MADRPKATVKLVEESEATGKVLAIFDDIKATKKIDFVPNLWRVSRHQSRPSRTRLVAAQGDHASRSGRTRSRLDPLKREIIALAVSATNGCAYCINSHTAAARKLGLDVEVLGEVMAVIGLFNTTNALADGYQVEPDIFPPQD